MIRSMGKNLALAMISSSVGLLSTMGAFASDEPRGDAKAGWPMFRGNPHLTGVATSALPRKLTVRWTFDAGEVVESTAAIADGVVYVGSDEGGLFALDLKDGSVRWNYVLDGAIRSSPTVVGEVVYFGDDEGVFRALNARDGTVRWTFRTAGEIVSSANHEAGRLVFGSYDGFVYCIGAADGALIWKVETQGKVHGTPAIVDGKVVFAGCDGMCRAVELSDGKTVREVSLNGYSGASAAVLGSMVFAGTFENEVLGIDWRAGQVVWRYHHAERSFPFLSSAAVSDRGVVIGGRDKMIHALDPASGRANWTFATKGRVDGSPVIVGDRVFVGSADGNLYALDLGTGRELWRFEAGGGFYASPAVGEGCLVIGTDEGTVYCFGASSEKRNGVANGAAAEPPGPQSRGLRILGLAVSGVENLPAPARTRQGTGSY